ncbi:unnamed protein product [Brachionus calyciflorus]|uniref:ATP-dependent DNA helicase n=1 Tax=Brachionus calyciflorus TaxID=104777 RepID=A0A814JC81_9BILA|nr:unnamed protein product [Brachionus calyciflorus]
MIPGIHDLEPEVRKAFEDLLMIEEMLIWPILVLMSVFGLPGGALTSRAFPKLFPNRAGDPTKKARKKDVTEAQGFKHLMKIVAKGYKTHDFYYPWAQHPRLKFWHKIHEANLTMKGLKDLINNGESDVFMKKMSTYAANITGSDACWYKRRGELEATFEQMKTATAFFTNKDTAIQRSKNFLKTAPSEIIDMISFNNELSEQLKEARKEMEVEPETAMTRDQWMILLEIGPNVEDDDDDDIDDIVPDKDHDFLLHLKDYRPEQLFSIRNQLFSTKKNEDKNETESHDDFLDIPTEYFGGISVILTGDPGQLLPVLGSPLYNYPPKDHLIMDGYEAYKQFDKAFWLKVMIRQQSLDSDIGQLKFIELLERLRNGVNDDKTMDDWKFLLKRQLQPLNQAEFSDAIRLFCENSACTKYNHDKLKEFKYANLSLNSCLCAFGCIKFERGKLLRINKYCKYFNQFNSYSNKQSVDI